MKIMPVKTVWVNQHGDTVIKTFGLAPGERDVYIAYKHNSTDSSGALDSLRTAKSWIYKFRGLKEPVWKESTIKSRIT